MEEPLKRPASLVDQGKIFVALGYGLYALALAFLVIAIATGIPQVAVGVVYCAMFGTMALGYASVSTKSFTSDAAAPVLHGEVQVTSRGIGFDGKLLAMRSELKQGFIIPERDHTLVRLERTAARARPIHLRVTAEADGIAILERRGFDAGHTAAEMKIASGVLALPVTRQLLLIFAPFLAFGGAVLGTSLTMKHAGAPVVALLIMMFLTYVFGLAFTPTKVRIGTDGIVTRWLGRERFIPFSQVRAHATYDEVIGTKRQRGVKLTLADGEIVKLPTGQTDAGTSEAVRLEKRITDAHGAGRTGGAAAATLLRGNRSAREWVRALRGAGEGAGTLRTAAVPLDVLLRVVEDANADETARVGAAIAVASSTDEDVKTRVRIAAEASASPKLRVALARATTASTDDELADLIEGIDRSSTV
ncbi:hypothetical protein BH09MYX1_BH09MYX1_13890 [soil metagenome]